MTKTSTHTDREHVELHVAGRTWEGKRATMIYELKRGEKTPASIAEAKRIAGDFDYLTAASVITVTTTITTTEAALS